MKINNLIKQNQGQVAIIVLLVSAVLLTLGLSASKNTITDVKVDSDEELLKSAFNVAESGINNYLSTGGNSEKSSYTDGSGGSATVDSVNIGGGSTLTSEGIVEANVNQIFWLVDHDTNGDIGHNYSTGTVNLNFDQNFTGAIKIDYFYLEGGVYKIKRLGCNYSGNSPVNGFNNGLASCRSITLTPNALLLSVTPIGSSTSMKLSGTSFPIQGQALTSVGTVTNNIKTQVKTRFVYKIPSFMFESITAKNIVR